MHGRATARGASRCSDPPAPSAGARWTCCARQRDHFRVVALTAGAERDELAAQVGRMAARRSPAWRTGNGGSRYPAGPTVLVEAATHPDVDIVVNAVVGAAGLDATLAALRAGKRVALANKETPGHGGRPGGAGGVRGRGRAGARWTREHSAVLQCVTGRDSALAPADSDRFGRALPRMAGRSGWRRRRSTRR